MSRTVVLVRIEVEGDEDIGDAARIVNRVLDSGVLQDEVNEFAADEELAFRVTSAMVADDGVIAEARTVVRDLHEGWPWDELCCDARDLVRRLSELIGEKYDFETGDMEEDGDA